MEIDQIMNKLQDFLEQQAKETGLSKEELKQVVEESYKNGIEIYGSDREEEILRYIKSRVVGHLLRLKRTPLVEVEFIPLFVDKSDFGALRQYLKAKEVWEENKEVAISEGYTDKNGNPLYQNGFRKGQPINLEEAITKTYEGFIKTDLGLKKAYLSVRGLQVQKIDLELGGVYKIKAMKMQKSTEDIMYLLAVEHTTYERIEKLSYEKVLELIKTHYKNNLALVKNIDEYYNAHKEETPIFVIVKGNVFNMVETSNKVQSGIEIETNNVLEIFNEDDVDKTLVCWVPKINELKFNFRSDTMDLVVAGILTYRENENQYQISRVMGIYYPEVFEKPDIPDVSETEVNEVEKATILMEE